MPGSKPSPWDLPSDVAKALANPHRLGLLDHLGGGEVRSVEALAELAGLSIANASQHLQVLRRCGLVQVQRDGKHMLYRLGEGPVSILLRALTDYSDHHLRAAAELARESISRPSKLDAVSWEELSDLLARRSITLLDVRPADEFAHDHLPGAINIPIEQLGDRTTELPVDVEVVAYCRGPFCVLSRQAQSLLHRHGFKVRTFSAGITALEKGAHSSG